MALTQGSRSMGTRTWKFILLSCSVSPVSPKSWKCEKWSLLVSRTPPSLLIKIHKKLTNFLSRLAPETQYIPYTANP